MECGLAFDGEGNIAVADDGNHCVHVMRYSDGAFIRSIGVGVLNRPSGVAFDAAGNIVVVDHANHGVYVLRYCDGALVRTIGSVGRGRDNGQFCAPVGGVAVDAEGHVVVVDSHNHRVQVLE
jgi:tripartite motif-containing protein 71